MKIKKVTFTHTGIKEGIKLNDWYFDSYGEYSINDVANNKHYPTVYEIVTRTETLEDWKPKENELVRYVYIDFAVTSPIEILRCSFYPDNVYHKNALAMGLMFPDKSTELAEQKLSEIKKLLQS